MAGAEGGILVHSAIPGTNGQQENREKAGAEGQNRTADTMIFSREERRDWSGTGRN